MGLGVEGGLRRGHYPENAAQSTRYLDALVLWWEATVVGSRKDRLVESIYPYFVVDLGKIGPKPSLP